MLDPDGMTLCAGLGLDTVSLVYAGRCLIQGGQTVSSIDKSGSLLVSTTVEFWPPTFSVVTVSPLESVKVVAGHENLVLLLSDSLADLTELKQCTGKLITKQLQAQRMLASSQAETCVMKLRDQMCFMRA